jgi:phosphate uptake regulator
MKKVLSGIVLSVILSLGADASMNPVVDTEKTGLLLQKQSQQCTEIFRHASILHTEKDIPTLVKTRKALREDLLEMGRTISLLRERNSLQNYDDYLLSIEEGLRHMERLAEEPVNKEVLEQVRNMCDFISTMDNQMLEGIAKADGTAQKTYQASR